MKAQHCCHLKKNIKATKFLRPEPEIRCYTKYGIKTQQEAEILFVKCIFLHVRHTSLITKTLLIGNSYDRLVIQSIYYIQQSISAVIVCLKLSCS